MVQQSDSRCQQGGASRTRKPSSRRPPQNEKDVITRVVEFTVNELAPNEKVTMVQGALDDVLRKIFHTVQSAVRSVIYNVAQQVMLNLLF